MTDLEKQAEELGIKIDKRWSNERLQEEIDKVLSAPKSTKAEPTIPVKLLYDRWNDEEIREPAGKIITVTVTDAKKLIATGKAQRADPLPGDE